MLFYNGFPYLIDLLVVLIGFFYENKLLRYFMHFGYFDIISNSFAMIIALITSDSKDREDRTIMNRMGMDFSKLFGKK